MSFYRDGPEKPKINGIHPVRSQGEICEFKTYHETIKNGQSSTESTSDAFGLNNSRGEDGTYALVIRRKFEEHKPIKTTLQVNSPHIQKAFRDVVKSYIAVPSDFTSSLELHGPFEMLVHHWDDLNKYRCSTDEAVAREHLDLLFGFMEHEIKPTRERALKMIEKQQIAYENAWVIYRPGDVMYTEVNGHPWLLVCTKTAYEENMDIGPYLEVHCSYTDDNGMVVGQATHVVSMNQRTKFPAGNPVSITDLDIYPREFVEEEEDSLEYRLKVRGEKFLSLKDLSAVAYDGPAEWLKEPPFDFYDPSRCKFRGVWLPYTETGRIVLDRKTFGQEQPLGKARVKVASPEPVYCPPYTLGYSLGRKQWCRFLVDHIREVNWNPKAWDSLVLPDKEKRLLRALISSHAFTKNPRDFMQQKGKGLVVLLHGTPGSGKTLTAETAAEGTRKALVSTSVGELSKGGNFISGSASFERELKKVLQYATIWQAVVLLDEADVFLEARKDVGSSERNALVAVFLKELEYFGGIVFLTTNRVNSFDIAMKSRIHLSLSYTPPEMEVRRSIWLHCLRSVPAHAREMDIQNALGFLADTKLNGREIANAVNTARTLARFDDAPLTLGHIETVLEVRKAFDESLKTGGLP
ncbi:P-loop containing nucleoside triphosphate hydrolase protein [Hypoxylon trugodes]|uniref:P-loop containing nucleoside triphosphate hydrolase protein n=1 Tax=Hypoxylon trugodes TaxID=326681 RepID=UPI00218EF731|nr:P-loop containing nucleoside triphosphate hydrolase protein [Hypoxylon trugodes]KAI1383418.1 P-loop containing nucleoside triphosphate hydrolase protein [Hypoxylon trugodes]